MNGWTTFMNQYLLPHHPMISLLEVWAGLVIQEGRLFGISASSQLHLPKKIFFLIFNWRIISLQCCVGFCPTKMWISHKYKHVPSLLKLPPTLTASHPSRMSQGTRLSFLQSYSKFLLIKLVLWLFPFPLLSSPHNCSLSGGPVLPFPLTEWNLHRAEEWSDP